MADRETLANSLSTLEAADKAGFDSGLSSSSDASTP
eukprot:CAMPEP_0197729722 /NCGR_PEP_ID=MMETSP1434-20131217/31698_1 /TAXON_ID=265543 /ORGANISM="Minutocellus polymorphus, Strain CCMP3303" /LENGTH=35 /DNA_ID= /DNA_START= /DNA_END= /DNA_ORIENTATION=